MFSGEPTGRGKTRRLPLFRPKVPMQNNCCDCGVFALQYAQEVLQRSPDILPDNLRRETVEGFGPHMFSTGDMHVSRSV